jgi:hypothetical protein
MLPFIIKYIHILYNQLIDLKNILLNHRMFIKSWMLSIFFLLKPILFKPFLDSQVDGFYEYRKSRQSPKTNKDRLEY